MEAIEVCVRYSLRRPEHKGGAVSVYRLLALRRELKVPHGVMLIVHDPDGVRTELGSASSS